MLKYFRKISQDESGAVTVDWVVLTSVVLGLAGAVVVTIQGATETTGTAISTELSDISVDAGF